MTEQYLFNSQGLWSVFGIIVILDNGSRQSSDSLLAWPDRKPSLENNRQDQNGIEIDLDDPKFDAREFVLKCAMKATDRSDFFTKYDGFRTALFAQDTHSLYSFEHDRTYNVFYKKQSNFRSFSLLDVIEDTWATFDVILGETNPSDNLIDVFLVDDQDRFLIA